MKIIIKMFFIISLSLLSSCSKDCVPTKGISPLYIDSCTTRGNNITINELGMFILSQDGNIYNNFPSATNVHLKYVNGTWVFPSLIYVNEPANVLAYYPYNTNSTNPHRIPLQLNRNIDYLSSSAVTATVTTSSINIELQHILAKLTFTLNGLPAMKIEQKSSPLSATYNLLDSTFEVGANGFISLNNSFIYSLPGTKESQSITLYTASKSYKFEIPTNTFLGGKEYNYSLKIIPGNKLILNGITIKEWIIGGNYEDNIN